MMEIPLCELLCTSSTLVTGLLRVCSFVNRVWISSIPVSGVFLSARNLRFLWTESLHNLPCESVHGNWCTAGQYTTGPTDGVDGCCRRAWSFVDTVGLLPFYCDHYPRHHYPETDLVEEFWGIRGLKPPFRVPMGPEVLKSPEIHLLIF